MLLVSTQYSIYTSHTFVVPKTSKEFNEEDTIKPNEAKGSCFTSVSLQLSFFGSEDCLKVQVMELT